MVFQRNYYIIYILTNKEMRCDLPEIILQVLTTLLLMWAYFCGFCQAFSQKEEFYPGAS